MFQRNVWASIMALCVCSLALCSSQASAQENTVLKQYYGNGVHAFYSGNYVEAFDLLSKPIDAKIEDPRPYYFRGFTLMELGRPEQAEKDFKAGAELELKDTTGRFPVNFALERCQGKSRIALENARNEVQLAAFQRRAKYNNAIYNTRIEDQKATLIPDNIDLSGGSTLDIDDGDALIKDVDSETLLDEDEGNANPIDNGNDAEKAKDTLLEDVDSLDKDDFAAPDDDNITDKPADDGGAFGGIGDDAAADAADDNAKDDDVLGDFSADADDDNADDDNVVEDKAFDDADDKSADNGIFGDEDEDNKADDAGAADDANAADDNAEADPFTQETPEETADANPFKNANLDEDDADAADNADDAAADNADAEDADAADKADDADAEDADAADKADDADAADENAGKDDPFSDFEF